MIERKGLKGLPIFLLIIMSIMSAAVLSACSQNNQAYYDGLKAYQEERFEESISNYLLAISQGKNDAVVYADLALSYLKAGKTDKALENMNAAFTAEPDNAKVNKKIGMFYEAQGEYQTALDFYQKSITTPEDSMSSEDLETSGLAAHIEKMYGCYDEAIRIYNILITQGYYVTQHCLLAGECYLKLNQVDAACMYFDMLENREDVRPEYYLLICRLLKENKGEEKADKYFSLGEQICGKEGMMSIGEYYADAGLFEEAAGRFSNDTSEGARKALAAFYVSEGRYQEAEQLYMDAIRDGAELSSICNQYLMLKAEQKEYTTAFQLLAEVMVSDDNYVRSNGAWNEVILYERTGNYQMAFSKLLTFMDKYPVTEEAEREYHFLKRLAE